MGNRLATCFVFASVILYAAPAAASRAQFVGTWVNKNVNSPVQQVVIDQNFSMTVTTLVGTPRLTTYGTGAGHPNGHATGSATFVTGSVRTTAVLYLGGLLTQGQNPNALDVTLFDAKGFSLDMGNTGRLERFRRAP